MEEAYPHNQVGKAREEAPVDRMKAICKTYRIKHGMSPSLRVQIERYMNNSISANTLKKMNPAKTVLCLVLELKKIKLHPSRISWETMHTTQNLKCLKSKKQPTKRKTISSLNQKWTPSCSIGIRAWVRRIKIKDLSILHHFPKFRVVTETWENKFWVKENLPMCKLNKNLTRFHRELITFFHRKDLLARVIYNQLEFFQEEKDHKQWYWKIQVFSILILEEKSCIEIFMTSAE